METTNKRLTITLKMRGEACDLHSILSDMIMTKNGIEAIEKEDSTVEFPFIQIVRYNGNKLHNEEIKKDDAKKYCIDVSQCKEGDVNFMLLCPPHTSERVEFADEKEAKEWQEYNWGTPFNAVSGTTEVCWKGIDAVDVSFEIPTELSSDNMTFESIQKYIPRKWLERLAHRIGPRVVINGDIKGLVVIARIVQVCRDVVIYKS